MRRRRELFVCVCVYLLWDGVNTGLQFVPEACTSRTICARSAVGIKVHAELRHTYIHLFMYMHKADG